MISLKDVESIQKRLGGQPWLELGSLKGDFEACKNEAKPND